MSECSRSELRDRLPDLVQGTLSPAARAEVESHLKTCDRCRSELALVTGAREAIVRRTPVTDAQRISSAVRKAGVRGRSGARAPRSARPSFVWRAAAAALLIAGAASAGYVLGDKRSSEHAPDVQQAVLPSTTPSSIPSTIPSRTPAPNQLAQRPTLTFGELDDLTPAEAAAMMTDLDKAAPTLDAEPESEIALETGS